LDYERYQLLTINSGRRLETVLVSRTKFKTKTATLKTVSRVETTTILETSYHCGLVYFVCG